MAADELPVILRTRSALRAWRMQLRQVSSGKGGPTQVGFVPTMGALHEGHAALLRRAVSETDVVVLSIFVNPAQFGPREDLTLYPRTLKNDLALARACGVAAVFLPEPSEIYPEGFGSRVGVEASLAGTFEGAARPGHFDGVCLVVTLLLHLVEPHMLYLGQKDYQQVVVLRRLLEDLAFNLTCVVVPTVRAEDGLALSSRNRFLDLDARHWARALPSGLGAVAGVFLKGERDPVALDAVFQSQVSSWLRHATAPDLVKLEYTVFLESWTLRPLQGRCDESCVLMTVLRVPGRQFEGHVVRLLDNLVLSSSLPWCNELAHVAAISERLSNKEP